MNYRHAYHAGNFADVLKHAVLALIIEHLKLKPAPFRIVDTHAGVGVYDLSGEEAQKTGEWQGGIGRLLGAPLPADIAAILAPYLDAVRAENAPGSIDRYPGSPLIARRLMRDCDRLIVNELHPADREQLEELFARDRQTKVMALDGFIACKSLLPPPERRGLVLIDPPFEQPGEFGRLAKALADITQRFASAVVLQWYPIKDVRRIAAFHDELRSLRLEKLSVAELMLRAPRDPDQLNGTGLVLLNAPYTLDDRLGALLPFLADRLGDGPGASGRAMTLA